ncbi:hypothetical protein [Mesorhizobium sp. CA16]|uniref:hypothetical protein n=1 Tax=Mesorhizobium sp. CA16 TaxID=588496 RepID=UPI001CCFC12A|nr:hypothetical protein [Mesorhizobium sp. CA16]MBZ9915700.1 hypothetical protein [Mesorhizobium sp. CA16]
MIQSFPPFLVVLAAIILIPLVPAVIIYLLLPSDAHVSGPLKGFNIALTGAFAGYFALVLLASVITYEIKPDEKEFPKYEEFTMLGSIDLTGPETTVDSRLVQLYLYPPIQTVNQIGANHFEWTGKIPMKRDSSGQLSFPYQRIVFEYPGYTAQQIYLKLGDIQDDARQVTFKTVAMQALPAKGALKKVEMTDAH